MEKKSTLKSKNLKSYLYTIANNLLIDHYRHKSAAINLNLKLETTSESPEYLMEVKEFDIKLKNAIGALKEKERVVFLMNRIDGLTFKEIAECLNLSVKAVEKRMHQALEKLHKTINYKL